MRSPHVKATGNLYDGHTLKTILHEIEAQIGSPLTRQPRPQRPARLAIENLYLRPEARRHRRQQARAAPPLGGRARHRPRQGQAPNGAISHDAIPPASINATRQIVLHGATNSRSSNSSGMGRNWPTILCQLCSRQRQGLILKHLARREEYAARRLQSCVPTRSQAHMRR
jgi:hypothetical protein